MTRTLYGFPSSANTHKVRLLLSMLRLPYLERTVDLTTGEHRRPEFLTVNPLGQVPVLDDGGRVIRDSHAILVYLARAYDGFAWYPDDPLQQALVAQWLFFDANDLHNGVGLARNHYRFRVKLDGEAARARGETAMAVLNARLADREWLELGRPTLADIACLPLAALAGEAGIPVSRYGHVTSWIERVKRLEGYIPMPGT